MKKENNNFPNKFYDNVEQMALDVSELYETLRLNYANKKVKLDDIKSNYKNSQDKISDMIMRLYVMNYIKYECINGVEYISVLTDK